jgi:Tfp pilus assembly protein PilO
MAKITQVQVWIIGVILAVIAGVGIYFGLIKPEQELLDAADQKYEAQKAIADTRPEKERDRKLAEKEVADAKAQWAIYDRTLMPNIDLSNLLTAMFQLWTEQGEVLGPKTTKFLQSDRSVRVVQASLQLPAPPTDPNEVNRKAYVYDLGQVTVQGTFENILKHAERWNKFDRLVLMDGLTLSGNSPALTGSYTLRAFIFTHNTDKAGPAIPQAAAAAGGMAGMGGGGMGGGMMGGGPPLSGPGAQYAGNYGAGGGGATMGASPQ